MEPLSIYTARQIQLSAQGLLNPPAQAASRESVMDCIRQMGILQIDTIHVIARSPYLVLFSRLGSYSPSWLDDHLASGNVFEYWAHAACFIPIEDYSYFRPAMLAGRHHSLAYKTWLESQSGEIERVHQRIRAEGPLRSADFNQTSRRGTWWDWKDEKRILEHLFNSGELMISRRNKFQRVYDLQERVLPGWSDQHLPSPDVVRTELVKRAVYCLGIAHPEWVADYYRLSRRGLIEMLQSLVQRGELRAVQVQGFDLPWYVHPNRWTLVEKAANGELIATLTSLLSPFDPLVWDRNRARQLFNFDYTIECYLPASKRQYGYFSLPILQRGRLVGRLDAKAHRKEKRFEVRSLHLEAGIEPDEQLLQDLENAIRTTAVWHACSFVSIAASNPADLAEKLASVFDAG